MHLLFKHLVIRLMEKLTTLNLTWRRKPVHSIIHFMKIQEYIWTIPSESFHTWFLKNKSSWWKWPSVSIQLQLSFLDSYDNLATTSSLRIITWFPWWQCSILHFFLYLHRLSQRFLPYKSQRLISYKSSQRRLPWYTPKVW